ncbi:MAG TPA: beta-galactosidase, partial [Anaerolineae bacterium]|nr:beta-galactosidase [Anaerolineae bacterium]
MNTERFTCPQAYGTMALAVLLILAYLVAPAAASAAPDHLLQQAHTAAASGIFNPKFAASELPWPSLWLTQASGCNPQSGDPRLVLNSRAASTPYLFGVINDDGLHYGDEWKRGVHATTLELQWKLYEPQEDVYNTNYINFMKQRLAELKAQGWYVQLVPGYQYVPDWVFGNYPNVQYVNQYGDRYSPGPDAGSSFRVINAPFNPQARALIASYIARIFQDFDPADFDSVRVGGSVQGELRYPPPDWNGHTNSFWAFDAHAQNPSESGIPEKAVGWRPGIDSNPGTQGRGQLLVNPGFEQTHSHFAVPAWSPDDEVSARIVADSPHDGSRALELTLCTTGRIHQFVRVEPNTSYHVGGWLRSVGPGGRARLFVNQYDANWQPVAGSPSGKLESGAAEWIYQTDQLTTSPSTQFLKVELDGNQPGTYQF